MKHMIRTETVLDSWKTVRADTIAAVEDMPAAELDFRATPELMTFREIARHILDASHGLTGLMLARDNDLSAGNFRERLKAHLSGLPEDADARTLAASLRSTLDQRVTELAAQPPDFFSEIVTRFDGQKVTRLEMLQFVKEHELTHRAQLFLYLRLKGIVPATTRRRLAKSSSR